MSMAQLSITPEINMGDILTAMIDELDNDDMVEFVEELMDIVSDDDFNHELYELMRRKHEEFLELSGITEDEYQSDYSPADYDIDDEDAEIDLSDDDEKEEAWITDSDGDFGEEDPMDIFTTDDNK